MPSEALAAEESRQVGLTPEEIADIRRDALDDPFFFARVICGHKDLTPTMHQPLLYMACGLIEKLVPFLAAPNPSYTVRQIKREIERRGINWRTSEGQDELRDAFAGNGTILDFRMFRFGAKSSAFCHAKRLWKMTRDPNISACYITNTDPKAYDRCKQIRMTIQSALYRAVFPERIPRDEKGSLTESRITLAGRTVPDQEPCLMAFGFKSSPTGYHFDEFDIDDIVGLENHTPGDLADVHEFLSNKIFMRNPGKRYPIIDQRTGTRWDSDDDGARVRRVPGVASIYIPMWYREKPALSVLEPGIPSDPAWMDLPEILKVQAEVLADEDEGVIAWRCNAELDPEVAGGKIFPDDLVDGSLWHPHVNLDKSRGALTNGDLKVGRPDWWPSHGLTKADGSPLMSEKTGAQEWRAFDPLRLFTVTVADQSFSETGDEWCVVTEGINQYNHRLVLDVEVGHGEIAMLDAMLAQVLRWKPRRIGQEGIAAANLFLIITKLDKKYSPLMRMEEIPHGGRSKEMRIRNFVAEVMRMGLLHLNPNEDQEFVRRKLKKYRPGPRADDNVPDAMAMAEVLLLRRYATKKDGDERTMEQRLKSRNGSVQSSLARRYGSFTRSAA